MNNIDKFINETDRMLAEEEARYDEALNEKALYDELKDKATAKEKAAKARLKELELARLHARRAQDAYAYESDYNRDADEIIFTESDNFTEDRPTERTVVDRQEVIFRDNSSTQETTERKGNGLVTGLVIGAAVTLLAIYGYKLVKDGNIKFIKSNDTKSIETTDDVTQSNTSRKETGSYNSKENVYTITENNTTETNTNNESVTATNNSGSVNGTTAAEANSTNNESANSAAAETNNGSEYNYNGNVFTGSEVNYVALDDAAFETLTAETIKTLQSYKLQVSKEDIIKYVMIRNIDKLRQDNNELINLIVGDQDYVETFADADHVIDAIMTYNLLYFLNNHKTDGFISASVGVFDETQKARVLEIEDRVYEIGKNYKDEEKYNELTYSLLRDMIDPTKEISELEDGVSYGLEWIDMYMVRTTFGTDEFIKLNATNADLIKYYVSLVGDGEEYENNAIVNGNVRNINALLAECENAKTRTK